MAALVHAISPEMIPLDIREEFGGLAGRRKLKLTRLSPVLNLDGQVRRRGVSPDIRLLPPRKLERFSDAQSPAVTDILERFSMVEGIIVQMIYSRKYSYQQIGNVFGVSAKEVRSFADKAVARVQKEVCGSNSRRKNIF
jgi:hypothetical protein